MFNLLARLFQKRPVIGNPDEAIAHLKVAVQRLHETAGAYTLEVRPKKELTAEQREALKTAQRAVDIVAAHGYRVGVHTFGIPELHGTAVWLEHRASGACEPVFADTVCADDWLTGHIAVQNQYAQAA